MEKTGENAETPVAGTPENIVLFPFMARGHLNPFVHLTHLLNSRFPLLTITIVTITPNLPNLRSLLSSIPTVRFAQLPFNASDFGLPADTADTHFLSRAGISKFYQSSDTLQPAFHALISEISESDGRKPVSIVSDMFLGWTVDVAKSYGIFHAVLYTSGPYAMSIYNSIWAHLPHRLTSADEFTLPDLPKIKLHRSQLANSMKNATSSDDSSVFTNRQTEFCRRSDGSLWNTVDVLEKSSLEEWARSYRKPVWAIGPLHSYSPRESPLVGGVGSPLMCTDWLNLHPPKSAVYVSFGSQSSISPAQMLELARGLEESGKPFIWVLRPPIGFDAADDFRSEWLPEGFEDRMSENRRGLLIRRWAPQMEILAHGSTGAFLSHCGWNSILESLSFGVPVIGWPLASEQFYNSKLLEEDLGVCVEMARGVDEMIKKDDVIRVLGLVLEGGEIRRKVQVLKEEMKRAVCVEEGVKGSSLQAVDEFVKTILEHRSDS